MIPIANIDMMIVEGKPRASGDDPVDRVRCAILVK